MKNEITKLIVIIISNLWTFQSRGGGVGGGKEMVPSKMASGPRAK